VSRAAIVIGMDVTLTESRPGRGGGRMTHAAPVTYALQFRGQVETTGERGTAVARASSAMLVSIVDREGPHGRFEDLGAGEAVFRVALDRSGPVGGFVDFGGGTTLRLRAAERHAATTTRRPYLRHGAALLEVVGGTGRLLDAQGWITSNFLLSDTGDLTDNHLGLLFVQWP
jgi:hypothetical protein